MVYREFRVVRVCIFASACLIAATATAGAAPRAKQRPPNPESSSAGQSTREQDPFRSCDVSVRDFVQGRKEATALPVKEVKADTLRMTLNFVHPFGDSGETPPNLGFMRGESIEERRKALNETKQKMRALEEAARAGNVWYVVALASGAQEPADGRRNPAGAPSDEKPSSASAVVFASIESKCIAVAEFKSVPLQALSAELRTLLGDGPREPASTESVRPDPPS
jgi:hypothetical protein